MNILFLFGMILIINYLNLIFIYIYLEKEYLIRKNLICLKESSI